MRNKIIIGMCAACLLAVSVGKTEAATTKKATIKKAASVIKTSIDDVAGAIWKNRGGVALGTAAVVVATKPEVVVQPLVRGTTAMATEAAVNSVSHTVSQKSTIVVTILACLLVAVLAIVGMRCLIQYLKDWINILPFLVIGIALLGCGVAEAGVIPIGELQHAVPKPPWWNAIGWIIMILTSIFW
jgi:hypothetical protein